MADAVLQLNEVTHLTYQFTKNGVISAVPTVTASQVAADGTTVALTPPTLQNSGTSPRYELDWSHASAGDYTVSFFTSDSTCDQYPGVTFYITCGQMWIQYIDAAISTRASATALGVVNTIVTAIQAVTDKFHFTGSSGVEKVNSQLAGANADVIDAASIKADAVTKIQAGLGTSANQQTILDRLGAFTGTGVNTVLGFFRALLRSDLSAPSDVGGTFTPTTDSTQAIADAIGALPTVPTLAAIVNGVWNELLAGHTTPNSAAQILIAAAAGSGAPTVPQIVNGILNELLAGHTTSGSVAAALSLIDAIYAVVQTIGAGVTFIRSPVSPNGDTELRQGVRYTGVHALAYTSDIASDLLASGVTVALNFANRSFPAVVTGAPGAWAIRVPVTEIETAEIVLGTYLGQLAQYEGGVEVPELSNFNVTMAVNP